MVSTLVAVATALLFLLFFLVLILMLRGFSVQVGWVDKVDCDGSLNTDEGVCSAVVVEKSDETLIAMCVA